ncbi:MAG: SDR family oxidoreductase [Bacteroidales bacterium]|nr:SDR family oxidoreductase [Bacteroidales bacterium]
MKKKILITGANKGIGFETARQLGKLGHTIFISGRNKASLESAVSTLKSQGITVNSLLMDVNDPQSIQTAADTFSASESHLDVLINNAGVLFREDTDLYSESFSIIEKTIQTNAYGPLLVIRAFLPCMNHPGRIINISSSGGSMSEKVGGWSSAYCVSKTLLNAETRHLAFELEKNGISVNAVCPGWVRTDMGGKGASRTVEKGAETPVWLALEAPQQLTGKFVRDKKVIPW